jgi:hypothetical protein
MPPTSEDVNGAVGCLSTSLCRTEHGSACVKTIACYYSEAKANTVLGDSLWKSSVNGWGKARELTALNILKQNTTLFTPGRQKAAIGSDRHRHAAKI